MSDNHITDFIKAAVNDKPIDAASAFDAMMEPKIATAIETDSVAYKQQMFNQTATETDTPEEDEQ